MIVFGPPLDGPIDVIDVLGTAGDATPDELALVSAETRFTWWELDDASTRLARSFLGIGLVPGARVASLMPNVPAVIVHYVACVKAGLVVTPLNYRYTDREIDFALGVSGADALVAHTERRRDVANSTETTRLSVGVLWSGADAPTGALTLEGLWALDDEGPALPTIERSEPAFVFFTSGSTGPPKGVIHTYDSIGWIAASTRAALAYATGDRFMVGSSLSHEGGVGFSFAALGAGVPIAVPRTVSADDVLPLLRLHRPTVAWTLPPLLTAWIRHPDVTGDDLDPLRMCMTGGDHAPLLSNGSSRSSPGSLSTKPTEQPSPGASPSTRATASTRPVRSARSDPGTWPRSATRTGIRSRPAHQARYGSSPRPPRPATGTTPTRPRKLSTTTAGSTPAT
jgi:long-chain acyl-CoA synthetase